MNDNEDTPLTLAVRTENVEIARFLLQNNCAVDKYSDMGNTALMVAIMKQNVECVNLTIVHGADLVRKNHMNTDCFQMALNNCLSLDACSSNARNAMQCLLMVTNNLDYNPLSLQSLARRSFWNNSCYAIQILSKYFLPREIFFFLLFLKANCSEEMKMYYLKLFRKF